MARSIALAAVLLAAPAVAKEIPLDVESTKLVQDGVSVHGEWIEASKDDWVVNLVVTNLGEVPFIIRHTDFTCARGTSPGAVQFARFGIGERTLDVGLGQVKLLQLVCTHEKKVTGEFRLGISKVWSNPSGDGRSVGEAIASDLAWVVPEEKVK